MFKIRFMLLIALGALSGCSQAPETPEFDILVINGTVYDGTLQSPALTNIGVIGDRIVSMSAAPDAKARQVIDASGLVVVPGFIDPHTHAEDEVFDAATTQNINYLTPGVTTVFIGNYGRGIRERAEGVA